VGALPAHDAAGLARAVALNVTAPLILSAAVMRAGAAAPDLRIAHISSGAARSAYPGWSVYGATKAALDQHARATALDAIAGLRICSIAPGVIDTGMQAQVRAASLADFPQRERFDALKRDGALATPEAAAGALVAHLLSDQFGAEAVADIRTLA
jgi:NAD(P)-dependent dehydrogenase (short-subunit alcohol dehydrogenase family)